jgi:hypothetical protein
MISKPEEAFQLFVFGSSAVLGLASLVWLFMSLVAIRTLSEDAQLPQIEGTALSVRNDSRYSNKTRSWILSATVVVQVGNGRQRFVEVLPCDNGTFPIADIVGKRLVAISHGTRVIGLELDGKVCRDPARYRQLHARGRDAANSGIPLSILGFILGCVGMWGGVRLMNKPATLIARPP